MENLKEKWISIDNWYKTQDPKKIKYLCKERVYDDGKPSARLQITMGWYEEISKLSDELKQYVFGEKIVTLDDIKNLMLKNLPNEEEIKKDIDNWKKGRREDDEEDYDEYEGMMEGHPYDDCGHSSLWGTLDIIRFWKKLDNNAVLSVIGNSTMDEYEIDISGGRSYYGAKGLTEMLFNYAYYTLGLTPHKFDENICNSGDSVEDVAFYYSGKVYAEEWLDPYLPETSVVDELYNKLVKKNNQNDIDNFNRSLKNMIDNFEKKELFKDKVEILKTLTI